MGHSFRIGGATYAAECVLPFSSIKLLGRWSSTAYESPRLSSRPGGIISALKHQLRCIILSFQATGGGHFTARNAITIEL